MVNTFLPLRGLLMVACILYCAAMGRAAPLRPLVIVFPGGQAIGGVSDVTDAGDKMAPPERSLTAARAVRDCFMLGGVLEATLYTPESPLFLRAAQEAKVTLARRTDLSEPEQIAVSRAAGAVYLVQVAAQRAADGGGFEIRLAGHDLKGKKYADRAGYTVNSTRNGTGDTNAIIATRTDKEALKNAVLSAANTLVARLMQGPLREYDSLTPGVPVAVPTAESNLIDPLDTEAENAALTQAAASLAEGDQVAAVTLLRHTINQHPLSAKARIALTKTYLAVKQNAEALSEAKRALLVADVSDTVNRDALVELLTHAAEESGDRGAARQGYEEIIAAQPDVIWARVALADLLLADGDTDAAELQYRTVREKEPTNLRAAQGLIKILGAKGDYSAALATLAPPSDTPEGKKARHQAALTLFDAAAPALADLLSENRTAWEAKRLSREAFYRATVAQAQRASALVTLLRAAPAPAGDPLLTQAYNKRILAASLLAQSSASLQTYLENGNADAGAQAKLWLSEFRKEMRGIGG